MLDPSNVRRAAQVGQLAQTSYGACLTPYSYFGLGRTNNYVESLFVGSTRHQPAHFSHLEGLIPNSQVVIVPWQPPGGTDPGTWTRKLYVHPGDWIPWVTVVIAGAMLVLAITVMVLHLSEKVCAGALWIGGMQQAPDGPFGAQAIDDAERRQQLGVLNFGAL